MTSTSLESCLSVSTISNYSGDLLRRKLTIRTNGSASGLAIEQTNKKTCFIIKNNKKLILSLTKKKGTGKAKSVCDVG